MLWRTRESATLPSQAHRELASQRIDGPAEIGHLLAAGVHEVDVVGQRQQLGVQAVVELMSQLITGESDRGQQVGATDVADEEIAGEAVEAPAPGIAQTGCPDFWQTTAIDKGITHGDSLVMTGATQVRTYAVYGFHDSRMGQALIEVGYKRRF